METRKHKILLCEDDPNLGMVLKNYLELNEFDVTLERDGRLGLEMDGGPGFDAIIIDAFSSDSIPAHLLACSASIVLVVWISALVAPMRWPWAAGRRTSRRPRT